MKKFCLILFTLLLAFICLPSQKMVSYATNEKLSVKAKSAILLDDRSDTIIYEKDAHKRLPIASMTKLASLLLILEAMDKNEFDENTLIKISKHSAETEGSSAFLDEGSEYRAGDLIETVIVCSANDSTVALAEKVAGSEENFVKMLNKKVSNLGLKDTSFVNATGLPAIDHYSSAYDVSKIYRAICNNPIYKKYSKIWLTELTHPSGRKTEIVNTNRLIKTYEGCESGKTGFTNEAKYCLSASASRSGVRLIGVIIGAEDSKTRFNEMANMFNYGFANFENKLVVSKETPLYEVSVKNAKVDKVNVFASEDFVKFLNKGEEFKYSLKADLSELKAPLKTDEVVGRLYVLDENNMVIHELDLVVREDVEKLKLSDILHKIYTKY